MSALKVLRAASRDVANERYVEVMEAIDALADVVEASNEIATDGAISASLIRNLRAALTRCGVPA